MTGFSHFLLTYFTTASSLAWQRLPVHDLPEPAASLDVRTLSQKPRIYLVDGLLTDDECAALIEMAAPRLMEEDSDNVTGDESRYSMYFNVEEEEQLPLLQHITKRLHRLARIPDRFGEGLIVEKIHGSRTGPITFYNESDPYEKDPRIASITVFLNG
ncbi:hypothetical protein FOZ62_005740, partial [Perkinsus olseni]